jgi:D-amino-acid dehydrogenase
LIDEGEIRRYPKIYVAAGHAMLGYTMGPITGRLISEMIAGKPLSLAPEPLSLERFF